MLPTRQGPQVSTRVIINITKDELHLGPFKTDQLDRSPFMMSLDLHERENMRNKRRTSCQSVKIDQPSSANHLVNSHLELFEVG